MTPLRSLRAACLFALLFLPAPAFAAPGDPFEHLYFSGDELVESATRSPKPLSQVAENVAVVTSAEIRDMNAHTLAEVLNRVTGVFVQPFGVHFGTIVLPHIQGSGGSRPPLLDERHVTVVVDGVPWNALNGGSAVEAIPVGIIERIEIIKGPASSSWGSSLGGVINVFTNRAGGSAVPSGEVAASYGERDAFDGRAELAGGLGPAGYYFQGQQQRADWPKMGGFESRSGFGKVQAQLGPRAHLTVSGAYTDPEVDLGRLESNGVLARDEFRSAFGRVAADAQLANDATVHVSAFRRDYRQGQLAWGDGTWAPEGEFLLERVNDETQYGVQGRLAWAVGRHALVLGADYRRGELTVSDRFGEFLDGGGFRVDPTIDLWGVYFNDTIRLGPVTVTPGVRFDDSTRSGSFTSPSLGAAWRAAPGTVVRASVARGFASPPLAALSGGGLALDPNPDLDPEQIWSYQAGAETAMSGFAWLKATVFRHEAKDSMELDESPITPGNLIFVNRGRVWRTGFEAEAETAAWRGLSSQAGFAFVRIEKSGVGGEQDQHQVNLGLHYRAASWRAQLFGHYVWWDLGPGFEEGRHNDFLWDLNASKTFVFLSRIETDLFLTVHNLFDGDQETDTDRGTTGRWVEAGARVRF